MEPLAFRRHKLPPKLPTPLQSVEHTEEFSLSGAVGPNPQYLYTPQIAANVQEKEKMKRSASASFDKDATKEDVEHAKKITKSVQNKKSAAKMHDDIDDYPSPIRVKKGGNEAPKPLVPLAVNEGPSEKELAAAEAARIRLGYQKADPKTTVNEAPGNETPMKCPTGPEPSQIADVEYIATKDLQPVDNLDETVKEILSRLATKDWLAMCAALNTVRQLSVHHPSECLSMLHSLVPAVLRLFKNPRSSVCKTSVLCLADLFHYQKDAMLPHLDVGGPTRPTNSVLCQLFIKSSTDKQFVAEEINKVLTTIGKELNAITVTQLLIPYASEHKNPKVRGKAGVILAIVTERMNAEEWNTLGMPSLLKVAAVLITDKTPDARDAARTMISRIYSEFHKKPTTLNTDEVDGQVTVTAEEDNDLVEKNSEEEEEEPYLSDSSEDEDKEPSPASPWQLYCEEHLSKTQAIAVLKVPGTVLK